MKAGLIYLFLFSVCIFKSEVNATPDTLWAPGQVIARLNSSVASIAHVYLQTTDSLAKDSCLNILDGYLDNIGVWKLKMVHYFDPEADTVYLPEEAFNSFVVYYTDTLDSVMGVVNTLSENSYVDFVHPNWLFRSFSISPNDPKWYVNNNEGQDVYMNEMGVNHVWEVQKGCSDLRVAVLDVGFRDFDHPDMNNKFTGFQYDAENQDNDASGNEGFHGLECASIIAANPDNNEGMAGIGWRTQVVPVKVSNSALTYQYDDLTRGIDWVVQTGAAKVMSISLGTEPNIYNIQNPNNYPDSELSLQTACNNGYTVVCAAGNKIFQPYVGDVCYPATSKYTISAGGLTINNVHDGLARWGDSLDISARDVDVWVAHQNGITQYKKQYGTSFSAPMVAAASALILSQNPYLNFYQVREILTRSAIKIPAMSLSSTQLFNPVFGFGRLDVQYAVSMVHQILNDIQLSNETILDLKIVHAQNSISAGSNFTIGTEGFVEFKAGSYIELLPGFAASPIIVNDTLRSSFEASISIIGNPCSNGGSRLMSPTISKDTISPSQYRINDDVGVFPNPTNGKINIVLYSMDSKYIRTVNITNIFGEIIYYDIEHRSIVQHDNFLQIDLPDMPNGVYFVKCILSDGSIKVKKVLLEK